MSRPLTALNDINITETYTNMNIHLRYAWCTKDSYKTKGRVTEGNKRLRTNELLFKPILEGGLKVEEVPR